MPSCEKCGFAVGRGGGIAYIWRKYVFMLQLKRFHRNVKNFVKIDCEHCGFMVGTMLKTLKSCARTKSLAFFQR